MVLSVLLQVETLVCRAADAEGDGVDKPES